MIDPVGRSWMVVWSLLLGCGPSLLDIGGGGTASGSGDAGDDGMVSASDGADGCVPTGDEVCDGIDNDCDGEVDEDIAPMSCGVGGCETLVTCENGSMASCVPGTPQPEACNLLDDDCDGEVDNGLGFGPTGERMVVRADEFDTGSCTSCRWAFGSAVAPLADGRALVSWNLGLYGGSRQPTLYARIVDAAGVPDGPISLQQPDFFTNHDPILALDPLPPLGLPVWVVHRVPGQEDAPGVLFVGPDGHTTLAKPAVGWDSRNPVAWSGERFVVAWEQEDALQLAILDANGALETMVDVDPLDRPASLTVGVYAGRVGVLVSRYRDDPERRDQWFILLDSFGNVLEPAHEIDVEYTTWQRLVGTESGWLHIRPNDFEEPSTRQMLAPDGAPIGEASTFADGRSYSSSGQDVFVPRPGQGEMLSVWGPSEGGALNVEFLGDDGDVLRGWSAPLEPDPDFDVGFVVDPHALFIDDHVLVAWQGLAGDAQANPVFAQPFGCVP